MQSFYAERFTREMTCTPADWLARLPAAIGSAQGTVMQAQCSVRVGQGGLDLRWRELPPLVIGLVRLQRLEVSFEFSGVEADARLDFMRRFDLYMQRGGG